MNNHKYVCHQCIPEIYLKKLIKREGDNSNNCSYCNKNIVTLSISNLADLFDDMINIYYEPVISNFIIDSSAEDAYTIILNELGVSEEVAEDLLEAGVRGPMM